MNMFGSNSLHNGNQNMNPFELMKKRGFSAQPESLYSMAVYDYEQTQAQAQELQLRRPAPGHFYPVDEYKDLSLREILDISDDFLFDDNNGSEPLPIDTPSLSTPNFQQMQPQGMMGQMQPQQLVQPQPMMQPQQVLSLSQAAPMASNFEGPVSQAAANMNSNSIDLSPKKKRRREDEEVDESGNARRFRPYQAGQWSEKFAELCEYRERMGHCLVPHTYSENLPLARWVKRQRYQYKLMRDGKSSTMTEERVKALEEIGFVWDSQGAAWGERLAELKDFKREFLHCNVPSNFADNPQLATWVKCQRRQYKLHMEGKPSNMTPQRIRELESLGFEWELRSYKKVRTC